MLFLILLVVALATKPLISKLYGLSDSQSDDRIELRNGPTDIFFLELTNDGVKFTQGPRTFFPALTVIYKHNRQWNYLNLMVKRVLKNADALIMSVHEITDKPSDLRPVGEIQMEMLSVFGDDPEYCIHWFRERGDRAIYLELSWE